MDSWVSVVAVIAGVLAGSLSVWIGKNGRNLAAIRADTARLVVLAEERIQNEKRQGERR